MPSSPAVTLRLLPSDEVLDYCSAPGNQLEYQRDYGKH
jgi:16S rRNA C967 or C1407 C5-methylase (RsmB/RsmF family)